MRKRRPWGRALLAGAATAALAALSPPPAAADTCGGCTITYSYDARTCTLERKAACNREVCVTIPDLSTTECSKTHSSTQTGVTAAAATGTATVQSCTGNPLTCDGPTTTCSITYKAPTLKPAAVGMPATGRLSTVDELGAVVTVTYGVVWTGSELVYTVANESDRLYQVFWFGTPFHGDFVAPGESLTQVVFADVAPVAAFRPIQFVDLDRGGVVMTEAVTYLLSADTTEGVVEKPRKIR